MIKANGKQQKEAVEIIIDTMREMNRKSKVTGISDHVNINAALAVAELAKALDLSHAPCTTMMALEDDGK